MLSLDRCFAGVVALAASSLCLLSTALADAGDFPAGSPDKDAKGVGPRTTSDPEQPGPANDLAPLITAARGSPGRVWWSDGSERQHRYSVPAGA